MKRHIQKLKQRQYYQKNISRTNVQRRIIPSVFLKKHILILLCVICLYDIMATSMVLVKLFSLVWNILKCSTSVRIPGFRYINTLFAFVELPKRSHHIVDENEHLALKDINFHTKS